METEQPISPIYSPAAVLHLFNNALNLAQSKKLIQLRGIFSPGKGGNYGGYYYDSLRDESSEAQLTVVVPALIREGLQANKTITVNGFITKRVAVNASRIEVQLTVTEVVAQTENKYSEEELRRLELQQEKAAAGYRDVQGFIKEKIILEQPFRIAVVIGRTGIIDQDIKHQLRESIAFYELDFHRVSLTSESEIISALERLDAQGYDIIVVSRGGGENLEIFNKTSIAERAIQLAAFLVTAIGHKDDVTLLQRVADKAFITPTALGQFLNEVYNETVAELANSRAALVESVKKQLVAAHAKEIENLQTQVKQLEELKKQSAADLQRVFEEKISGLSLLQEEKQAMFMQQLKARSMVVWIAVVVSVLAGLIIGYLIARG